MIPRSHTRKKLANCCTLASALLVGTAAGPARAQDQIGTTWIGNGGVWGDVFNWDCILGGGAGLCLPNNGPLHTWRVFIDAGQLCNLNTSPTIDQIDMFPNTTLNHFDGFTLSIIGVQDPPDPLRPTGVFSLDDATYMMSSIGNNTSLVFTDGPLIIGTGGQPGLILMSDNTNNRIYAAADNEALLIGNNITIEGAGQIGFNRTTVTNQGTIRATRTAPLILDPGTGGFVNNLFLLADSGGTLRLDSGSFDNTNGTISAVSAGSTVMLNGATITGGIVQSQFGTFQLNGGVIENATLLIQTSGLVSAATTVGNITNQGVINHNDNVTGLRISGAFENQGSYFMNSVGNNTDLILEADTTLTGGGEIDMSANIANRIYASPAGGRLTNVNNRIHGAGVIGRNVTALTNSGIIEADENGVRLTIAMAGDVSVNSGVFRASNGGILCVSTDTFDQSGGGLVEALGGSLVELFNPTMIGGTFNTVGTGVVRITAGSTRLDAVANTGLIEIPNNVTGLRLLTSLANSGTIDMLSIGNNTDLVCETDVLLTGGGTINMSNSIANRIYTTTGTLTLTNVDNTIRGSGQFGRNNTTLVNQGTIIADQPARLQVNPSTGGMTNSNLMQAQNGGTLELWDGPYDNTAGQIRALTGSTVRLNGGAVITGGAVVAETGGTLQFNGGRTTGTVPVIQAGATGPITAGGGGADGGLDNFGHMSISNNVTGFGIGQIFNNVGTLAMNSLGSNTDLILESDTTLTGGGEIDMSANIANRIYASPAGGRLTNVNNRIHGAGVIGRNVTALTNSGIIEADENGVRLIIDMAGDTSVNSGVFRASNGGILRVSTDTFDQSGGGLVEALDGALVELSSATMIGGTFSTVGTGVVRVIASATRLDAAANTGLIECPDGTSLNLLTSLVNSGTIDMLSIGNNTDLVCETDGLLTGGGTINMSNNIANRIYATVGTLTLTNVDNTIRGSGQFGRNNTTLVNQGAIIADQPAASLLVDPSAGGLDNQGSLRAENGAELRLEDGPFTTSGSVFAAAGSTIFRNATDYTQTAGSTIINGSLNMSIGGTATFNGGILGGSGTANASVDNAAGSVEPGASPGTLTINDDYTQGTGGSLAIELGGLIGGTEHDVLVVNGTATLAGRLEVLIINGFPPQIGPSFAVLPAGSISGVFDETVLFGFPPGLDIAVDYANDTVTLTVISACDPCDMNCDGDVNAFDIEPFLDLLFDPNPMPCDTCTGDVNGDGRVDAFDIEPFLNCLFP